MIYLHPDDRLKVAAISHTISQSVLVNVTQVTERDGVLAVTLTQPPSTLSSGESILWEFCRSIAGDGPGVSMFAARGELDDHSRRVMHEAVGLWFGIGPVEAVA